MSNSTKAMELARCLEESRDYWQTRAGQSQWEAQRACLGPVCERLFGAHSLEMGMAAPLTTMCPIRHVLRWAPVREMAQDERTLICEPQALPLPDGCLALTVIHHLLESLPHAHHALQEAARVTSDDGALIIFGFMPYGLAGLDRQWPGRRQRYPWSGTWRTPSQLGDWLAFVDFEIDRVDYCGFQLPGRHTPSNVWETLGRRYNLPISASYMIRARRKQQRAHVNRLRFGLSSTLGKASLGATRSGSSRRPHE
ncbi:methyltransferase domain-containing protein [Halomonas sp. Bachu 37]|uniref:methyltransferase domain-containing protein n=1 Tax=Halomonas kashgarensis TaxID=3084920 RepID=UPI0032168CAD